MPNPFKELQIALPNSVVQKYIGDKVRHAERLRAWAAKIQAESAGAMPAFKPLINHYTKNSFRVPQKNVIATRLDSSFSHPDHRSLDQMMKKNGCNTLGKIATPVKAGWDKKAANTFLYYEIGGLNVANGTISPVETLASEAPSRATTQIKQGDVLISTVRPNRRNVGFVIEDAQDKPMIATSGFSILRFETLADAAFYHSWLRTEDATSQLMRWNSGSAYPAIDEDVPLYILVPEFEASLRERLGQALLDAHFAFWFSSKLTNVAKWLVEAVIENQLSEAELIAAEQALQAGNDQPDRRILNRLKSDGVDGQGQALFSDLDQLYSLLQQADLS
jgi:type I restriction enzyme S subunit